MRRQSIKQRAILAAALSHYLDQAEADRRNSIGRREHGRPLPMPYKIRDVLEGKELWQQKPFILRFNTKSESISTLRAASRLVSEGLLSLGPPIRNRRGHPSKSFLATEAGILTALADASELTVSRVHRVHGPISKAEIDELCPGFVALKNRSWGPLAGKVPMSVQHS